MSEFPLSNYHWPLHDKALEEQAKKIAKAVIKAMREQQDNLGILAAIRRALVEAQ